MSDEFPQAYPAHETDGVRQLVGRMRSMQTQIRESTSNLLRTAGVRGRPGRLSSLDFDGTSRTDLGTQGWMLGAEDGGPSYLALNGVNVYEDLAQKQAALAAQTAYLSSLITRQNASAGFNTGVLTNDSDYHLVGAEVVVANLPVTTGKVRVILSCDEVSISTGGNAVIGLICYGMDGLYSVDPAARYARLYQVGGQAGVSLMRVGTIETTPGVYTFRMRCGYWSAGSGSASVNFGAYRMIVEVIGSD